MDGTKLPEIPALTLHEGVVKGQVDAERVSTDWLTKLERRFSEQSFGDLSDLFIDNCWWRDIVGLSWDFTCKQGQESISKYLASAEHGLSDLQTAKIGGLKPLLLDFGGMIWIQTGFTFKTLHGEGKGLLKLGNVAKDEWKAWTVFTQLEKLNFQKEVEAQRAASVPLPKEPVTNGVNGHANADSKEDLQVLIVGAAQSGLMLGARLQHMGIKTRLVERSARLGDSWRERYQSVTLHTPTYTDHWPFMKIPETWPRFLTGDKIAEFMEHYGQLMGLDIVFNTEVTKVTYDEKGQKHRVDVRTPEGTRTISTRHVVLATGVYGDQPRIPRFPGQEDFKGQIYHAKYHRTAGEIPDIKNKKVVVIGCATSGHDISADFVTHGAKEVTMVQRHAIYSISRESWENFILSLWNMEGLSTEEADIVGNAIPLALIRTMSIGLTQAMAENDKAVHDGLKKAGLELKEGHDGYGLADYQLIKGGQYYIDQGANQMIIEGKIKIQRCEEGVREFQSDGLTLANGTKLEADAVVLATGFESNVTTIEKLFGPEVVEKIDGFGGLDHEQERSGWWRATGVPGFWYMTGSFMYCRQFSLPLALQIAAVEKGLNKSYYGGR
ncbi:putative indole-3-pyruvate monooxygenase YUCCA9 [Colletotrichum spaethianum]|uniref:Indole-3-pyruvate monooxygenase YUCCA9 n=1 Tax=Colletotrichum spaethianum TaxID=700344 RepID=A0AA37LHY3_9PEZI|nr:putative indole-3-pyruvate monooxygenase YUCCA9 [Colletotrichum spaethianum]GKT46300.1 putative indole-3-pyruvate monooxygenase YUCCA9 [Colletotrichum spaethianum]